MIKFGSYTYSSDSVNVLFHESASITIGKFCSIASGVTIYLGGNHRTDWISTFPFTEKFPESPYIPDYATTKGDVVIGNDVWIGNNVTIMSGVTIGDGAAVGAMSVVGSDVAPYSIVCGNPARHKRFRFDEETVKMLLDLKWWDWDEEKIRGAIPFLMSSAVEKLVEYSKGGLCFQ